MDLKKLLADVKNGAMSMEEAERQLAKLPYEDIGCAKIDYHRALRVGFPEVIYCEGKTDEEIIRIVQHMRAREIGTIMGTRLAPERFPAIAAACGELTYYEKARIFLAGHPMPVKADSYIAVATGGTADIPVAEEAAVTAEIFGSRVERCYDVGVAGIHRLLSKEDLLRGARAVVAVAGMEGALASVVAGLVAKPVIAVPTSVGYGASFGGIAPLLTMLNSCAAGVSVVNIDNGFGAGYLACMINHM